MRKDVATYDLTLPEKAVVHGSFSLPTSVDADLSYKSLRSLLDIHSVCRHPRLDLNVYEYSVSDLCVGMHAAVVRTHDFASTIAIRFVIRITKRDADGTLVCIAGNPFGWHCDAAGQRQFSRTASADKCVIEHVANKWEERWSEAESLIVDGGFLESMTDDAQSVMQAICSRIASGRKTIIAADECVFGCTAASRITSTYGVSYVEELLGGIAVTCQSTSHRLSCGVSNGSLFRPTALLCSSGAEPVVIVPTITGDRPVIAIAGPQENLLVCGVGRYSELFSPLKRNEFGRILTRFIVNNESQTA